MRDGQIAGRGAEMSDIGVRVLSQVVGHVQIFFGGAVIPWLMNTPGAIPRGTGNMKLPSAIILTSAACQIVLGGILGLGLGPMPQFGMRGVASGSLIAYSISASIMAWYIFSGHARVRPGRSCGGHAASRPSARFMAGAAWSIWASM
jgi:Na+-driven multidrug efflux pump